jgi:hypothetical protein
MSKQESYIKGQYIVEKAVSIEQDGEQVFEAQVGEIITVMSTAVPRLLYMSSMTEDLKLDDMQFGVLLDSADTASIKGKLKRS